MIAQIDRLSKRANSPLRRALVPVLNGSGSYCPGHSAIATDRRHDLTSAERRNLIVAGAAIAANRPDRAIEVLDAFLEERDGRAHHPRIYERLAEAYVLANRAADAVEVLRHALALYADDDGVKLSLANALASGSSWRAAIDQWEQVPLSARDAATVWTCIGISRAYRNTGATDQAADLAIRAAGQWPQNEVLRREVLLCRPFQVDWKNSWEGSSGITGENLARDSAVDSLGFMNGGSAPLRGRIGSSGPDHPEVILTVNGRAITSTFAASTPIESDGKLFSINCADMLQFIGNGDCIRIVCNGYTVPMPKLGAAAILNCDHESRIETLFEMLDDGFVFTKNGRLRAGHNDQSRDSLLDLFARISNLVSENTGQTVYPFYGNLLGMIRENDFIAHDVGGFDSLYLCKGDTPSDVKAEVAALYLLLANQGFDLTLKPHSILIRQSEDHETFVDMSYGWFNEMDQLNVSFGWRFDPACGKDRFVRHRSCRLVDRDIPVPGNSEAVLEQLYGPQWPIPDQGFPTQNRLQRDNDFLFSESEILSLERAADIRT
jgi:tetratricopeptide (TPR) repeat protein